MPRRERWPPSRLAGRIFPASRARVGNLMAPNMRSRLSGALAFAAPTQYSSEVPSAFPAWRFVKDDDHPPQLLCWYRRPSAVTPKASASGPGRRELHPVERSRSFFVLCRVMCECRIRPQWRSQTIQPKPMKPGADACVVAASPTPIPRGSAGDFLTPLHQVKRRPMSPLTPSRVVLPGLPTANWYPSWPKKLQLGLSL